jgi:membrane protein required for colicin V production
LNKADIIIALILAIGMFAGYRKGFLLELFFLLSIILGVFIGFKLMGAGVDYLAREFNADKAMLPYISFTIIFLIVMVVVSLIGRVIKDSVDKTFLGRMDAVAGAALGLIKFAFGISVMIWLIEAFEIALPEGWKEGSTLYPLAAKVAPTLSEYFGEFLPFFKETFRQF